MNSGRRTIQDADNFRIRAPASVRQSRVCPKCDTALAVLEALLQAGADPNALGQDGTPLHRAAGSGVVESARLLLSHGADIEARMLVDGDLTPLMHAALMGQPQMVRFLLDSGANRAAMSRTSLIYPPMTLQALLKIRKVIHAEEILEMLKH